MGKQRDTIPDLPWFQYQNFEKKFARSLTVVYCVQYISMFRSLYMTRKTDFTMADQYK